MQFDLIDIQNLGENTNPNSYVSIDFWLDLSGDLIFFPDGSLGSVSGYLKLEQDIRLFLLSPQRTSLLDETWGNPVIALIGSAPMSSEVLPSAIDGALKLLQHFKNQEPKLRGFPLEGSELIKEITRVQIVPISVNPAEYNVFIELVNGLNESTSVSVGIS